MLAKSGSHLAFMFTRPFRSGEGGEGKKTTTTPQGHSDESEDQTIYYRKKKLRQLKRSLLDSSVNIKL